MKKFAMFSIFFGSLLCLPFAFAGVRPAPIDFAFEKGVVISSGTAGQEVAIPLDTEILNAVDERFGNFGIYSKENEALPFSLFYENFGRVDDATVIDISSSKRGKPQDMLDDNQLTAFQFDERTDKNEASWVLIDLGKLKPLNRAEIFMPQGAEIRYLEVEAGATMDDMKSVVSKRAFQWRNEFTTDPVRYVKVSFWGLSVRISDIRLTTSRNGTAYITAPAEGNAKILYGGNKADYLSFEERLSKEKTVSQIARLTRQKWNPVFVEDYDQDGIANQEDNCPFASNKSQKDTDKDRVGDACDNAPEVRNVTQSDLDGDGVGDIIDNCKLKKNPDQKNKDGDQFGDACDTANEDGGNLDKVTDVVSDVIPTAEGNKNLVLIGGILLAAFVGIGIAQWRKKKNSKK